MKTAAKIIIVILAVITLGLANRVVQLQYKKEEEAKLYIGIIRALVKELHKSDELLLKTHQDYNFGVDSYGDGGESY